jgi:hypothetical protein
MLGLSGRISIGLSHTSGCDLTSKYVYNTQQDVHCEEIIESIIRYQEICLPSTMHRDEVTGRWRKLHNEELHNLRFSKYN